MLWICASIEYDTHFFNLAKEMTKKVTKNNKKNEENLRLTKPLSFTSEFYLKYRTIPAKPIIVHLILSQK